jgi:hypothetical protein
MNSVFFIKSLLLFLGLLFPLALAAQTSSAVPEGATLNKDKCLGYDLEYKHYSKPIIAQVQADMYQLYQQESDWQTDAKRKGKPLNDGILGPITWSWMQRFCKNFALHTTEDVAAALPTRARALASFSEQHRDDATTLISNSFAQWAVTHITACDLDTQQILAQGSDENLQALLRCYRQPKPVVIDKPAPVEIIEPYQLYVLRADDFEAMAGAVAKVSTTDAAIMAIAGKSFPDKLSAMTELQMQLSKLPPEESKNISDKLSSHILKHTDYVITDKVLNDLSQQGISDALFEKLAVERDKKFIDQSEFTEVITAAIKASAPTSVAPATAFSSTDTSASSSSAADTVPAPHPDKLLLQIQLASQQEYYRLDKATAQTMVNTKKPVAAAIIKLLETLKDIEYPTAHLLDLAIKNRILKASGICKLDKSNTQDRQLAHLEAADTAALFNEINQHLASEASDTVKFCNEDHIEKLGNYYLSNLRPIVAPLYSEPMPAYNSNPLWNGGNKDCGCVPNEIQTTAYGIFPYWKTGADAQAFDFSTFNRVAYFGLSATDDGKLMQINSRPASKTLLNDNSDNSKAFIREARRYGSKVDWIIEKEFSSSPDLHTDAGLKIFFDSLHNQLVQLLATPLTDPGSRLRPLMTLGLAAQPTNGDGVTLYFKNYPTDAFAKDRFDAFFKKLKMDLATLDKNRDRWRGIKTHTYVNIMTTQSEFSSIDSVFGTGHIDFLTQVSQFTNDNLSIAEIQESVKTLVILLLEDPYYRALDEIYAVSSSIDRSIIAPLMFTDYSGMDIKADRNSARHQIDERQKRLAYIHESFGGGGFWPIIEYTNNSDGKDYSVFNSYISKHFSPGYNESLWNETLCGYRWLLIAVMNLWLLLALAYLVIIFYIYPQRCKKLPIYIRWLSHPLTVITLLLPPIVIWVYLIVADPLFNMVNLSSLLGLVVIGLALWSGLNAIAALKEQKPNRHLLHHQRLAATPHRQQTTTANDDELNRNEVDAREMDEYNQDAEK